jgi:hypothetical protein
MFMVERFGYPNPVREKVVETFGIWTHFNLREGVCWMRRVGGSLRVMGSGVFWRKMGRFGRSRGRAIGG